MPTELARIAVVLKRTLESLHGSVDDLARELVGVLGVNQTDRRALELILLAGEKFTTPGLLADRSVSLPPAPRSCSTAWRSWATSVDRYIRPIVGFLTRTDELQQAHLNRMRELDPYPR
jgi:hypothetical protein